MQNKLVNVTEQDIKFSEVDSLGIVWHGHYVRYFEDGREAFGKQYGLGYLEFYTHGYVIPIVNIQCDYKRFLRYGDRIAIETTYMPCEPAKLIFEYRLSNIATGEVVVAGSTTQVFLSSEKFILQLSNPDFFQDWKTTNHII